MSIEAVMYEPINIPEIHSLPDAVSCTRFALMHNRTIVYPDSKKNDPLHLHPYWEIYLHLSDEGSFLVNGHLYSLKKGDVILTATKDLHMRVVSYPIEQENYCLWLDIPESSPIAEALRNLSTPYIQPDAKHLSKLCFLLSEIEKTLETNDTLYLSSLILQAVCTLRDTAITSEYRSAPSPLFQQILNDINENCTDIRNVKHLCERHYTSPSTLNRLFQKHLHLSPHALLRSHKLAAAAKLLENGESVMSACLHAGFSDCSHFIVLFKRKFGVTPRQYRMSTQGTAPFHL